MLFSLCLSAAGRVLSPGAAAVPCHQADANVELLPAGSEALVELVDLLRSMLSLHGSEVPEPAEVVLRIDSVRRKLNEQVAPSDVARLAAPQADAAAGIVSKLEKHAACLRACQAMASEASGRVKQEKKKARTAEQACNVVIC